METVTFGRRARTGAGFTLPAAAAELNVPYKTLAKAVDRGEARAITFGGTRRLTTAEVNRLKALFAGDAA